MPASSRARWVCFRAFCVIVRPATPIATSPEADRSRLDRCPVYLVDRRTQLAILSGAVVCLSGSCGVSSSPVHGRQVGVRPGISPPAINATGGARREAGVIGLLEGTHEPGCGVLAGSRLARRLPAASMRPVRRLLAAPLIALLAAA